MRLQGKTILVTGAAGVIGQGICHELAAQGARLGITDRVSAPLEKLAGELADIGATVSAVTADGSDSAGAAAMVDDMERTLGPVHGLVNVAGVFRIADFVDTDQTQWQEMIAGNLFTAMHACRLVLPGMIERGHGSVVNFASTAGEYGSIRPAADYAAAKGGVIAFSKSLAREVSPRGVRVNCVSPGPTDTPALQSGDGAGRAAAAARTLVGRMGTAADHAYAVVYLLADESTWVTGTVLQVNGGSLI
jgi:NAD(P)-dependent dehydrogenase (short-subunit alcohol dehydrogenase family)